MKNEQVNVVLTQANIETNLQNSLTGGLSDGSWHTLTLTIEDGKRLVVLLYAGRKLYQMLAS